MVSPAVYRELLAGESIITVGKPLLITCSKAGLLVTEPEPLLNTHRKLEPLSESVVELMVYDEAVAPEMLDPLRCH